ncbi:MAG: hypothetical protein P8I99_07030, partial [Acidimicrobiales bacterium]|nr:hypothetical protein [Acidimicrobiales bacterium]
EKIKERAREEGLAAIRKGTDLVEEELLRVISDYGESLKVFVENAGDRLYRQIEEVLQQVLDERRDHGDVDLTARIEVVDAKRLEVQRLVQLIQVGRKHLVEFGEDLIDRCVPQLGLVREVVVDLRLMRLGTLGDRRRRRAVKASLGELDDRRLEQ